jgi:hypothetical protein
VYDFFSKKNLLTNEKRFKNLLSSNQSYLHARQVQFQLVVNNIYIRAVSTTFFNWQLFRKKNFISKLLVKTVLKIVKKN